MSNLKKITKHLSKTFVFASFMVFLSTSSLWAEGNPDNGKTLFKKECAKCHYITDKKFIGPGLAGVEGRWSSKDNLYAWIKNSSAFLKTGDKYANDLFTAFGGSVMPAFPQLDNQAIDDILAYIAKGDVPPPTDPNAVTAPGAKKEEKGLSNNTLIIILIVAAFVLLILVRALTNVTRAMENVKRAEAGEEKLPDAKAFDFFRDIKTWLGNHKKFALFLGIILISFVTYKGFKALNTIGIYQGYEPTQPINFSHVIHVKQNGIECKYCHSTVEKSKHASIPSTNVCMNCHKGVQQGPSGNNKEITKIYASIGWNPIDMKYFDNPNDTDAIRAVYSKHLADVPGAIDEIMPLINKPVEWVQIHNLPDHVFFSHQQHVKVGKIDCAECHGDVKEMPKVKQHSPLTMGWCIDCHRKTEVQFANNGYYERLHNYYKEHYGEYEMQKGQGFTVEKIGGLECSKCHY